MIASRPSAIAVMPRGRPIALPMIVAVIAADVHPPDRARHQRVAAELVVVRRGVERAVGGEREPERPAKVVLRDQRRDVARIVDDADLAVVEVRDVRLAVGAARGVHGIGEPRDIARAVDIAGLRGTGERAHPVRHRPDGPWITTAGHRAAGERESNYDVSHEQ